jgi:iron complex outermembrane receptor protein
MRRTALLIAVASLFITVPAAVCRAAGQSVEMEPVVVSSTRQDEEAVRIPAHITVITADDIARSDATNAGELLRDESGITVVNTSGSSPSGIIVDARGFNNGGGNGGRMLVLIDGRRANLVDTSSADWAAIPVDAIERIEITRGSSTSLYGDNALAGVINIITKQGNTKPSIDGTLKAGSYQYWNRNAALTGTGGPLSYFIFGGYESTDGFRENSDYRASNYIGNFTYRTGPASALRFRSGYLSNDRKLPGALTKDEIASEGRDASVADDAAVNHQGRWDAGYESQFTPSQWLELSGGQTVRGGDGTITFPGSGMTDLSSDSRSTAIYAKYRVTRPFLGRENRLMLGTDLSKEKIRAGTVNDYSSDPVFPFFGTTRTAFTRRLVGAYASEEFSVLPTVILTFSGRMDWASFRCARTETSGVSGPPTGFPCDSHFFRLWSPKAGVTYLTSPASSLYLVWSRSFRFPNQDELTGIFGLTDQLDPERATTIEFGSQAQIGQSQLASVSIYRMEVSDEILYIPPTGGAQFGQNENIPKVQHKGVELSVKSEYSKNVRFKAGYTLSQTKIKEGPFSGSELPITPTHSGSGTIEWGDRKGLLFTFTGRFSGRRILASDLANDQEKLPKYAVYDTRLSYASTNFEAFVGVGNLFDRKYVEFGGVGGSPFGSRIGYNPAPGRNYIGGGTVHF